MDIPDRLRTGVREVPDFPLPGIRFRDATPLLTTPGALAEVTQRLAEPFRGAGVTHVVAVEARGFLFGAPLAVELAAGLIPVRKPGKLPAATLARSYTLEYGSNTLEIHRDAAGPGDRVLVVDDLLATGGTARSAAALVEMLGARVLAAAFVMELVALGGRALLAPREVLSLLRCP